MYDRFTDRARKVMQLANQEAQRFNHEYIGTEHILLGLIGEDTGVAANVLKNHGIDLRKIRLEVEKLMQCGPAPATMGKLPQTPRAKKVIDYSIEESQNLNHNYVGTEHILLGLLREQEGIAAQVLMNLGLKLEKVREEVLNLLGCESIEQAMKTKPLHEIEAGLDLAENAGNKESLWLTESLDRGEEEEATKLPKHVGDSVSADAPPEEPLTDVLDGVTGGMVKAIDYLIAEIGPLVESSDDVALKDHVWRVVHLTRVHAQAIDATAKNMCETIRVMRAEATKVRTESDAAIEGSLAKLLECVVDHVDLMMDPISTETVKFNAGQSAKRLCLGLIHLAHLSAHVDPQVRAMATGFSAVDRAIPTPETPTDADEA